MEPMPREDVSAYLDIVQRNVPREALGQIRYAATDNTSGKMWRSLRDACPNLKCPCLDTIHLPIVYEYATWHKRTSGSALQRAIMMKFHAVCDDIPGKTWGDPSTGAEARPLTREGGNLQGTDP